MPVMVAASSVLLPHQDDWPPLTVVTGAWELTRSPRRPDDVLARWLTEHPGSAYVGFGSMLSRDPVKDLRLIDEAARRACVTVVHRLDDNAPVLQSTDMVQVVRDVDHGWLFPRCGAVVHHGGAGTTHAALVAGVPSAVIAHGFDQPFHGRRLHELGVGPKPLRRGRLGVATLAELLWELVHGPRRDSYVENAAAVGASISREGGTVVAADWLEARFLGARGA